MAATAECYGICREIDACDTCRREVGLDERGTATTAAADFEHRLVCEIGLRRDKVIELDAISVRLVLRMQCERRSCGRRDVSVIHEGPVAFAIASREEVIPASPQH